MNHNNNVKADLSPSLRRVGRSSMRISMILCLSLVTILQVQATRLVVVKVVDRDYLMISFKDGDVEFVDDGLGPTAFTGNTLASNNYVVTYGEALDITNAINTGSWVLKSSDDPQYTGEGVNPVACFRKSKLNGMAQMDWNNSTSDFNYEYTMEHHIFLELPHSMEQGKSYTLEISSSTQSDVTERSFTFDIFNSPTEAIHTNLVGYSDRESIKAADLYMWMGDGGARDYSDFEGNDVYIYDVNSGQSFVVGTVSFYTEKASEASGHILIQSDVWTADFSVFNAPGTYRLAIDGVGCSENFTIGGDVFFEPFRVNTLGYFYMRIGQDNLDMTPVPRQPLYIPGESPANTKVIITDFSPYHADWETFSGDKWDQPGTFANYVKAGSPENPDAYGGWSDAADWDRHLEHSINIYDMLLPYILTGGNLPSDTLGIAESGNGIPDVLDEARMEVDFWLRLRYGKGYSHGVSCPSNNTLYQADNTPMAAWANAANAAMLADAFRISGHAELMEEYRDSALVAYAYAGSLPDQMLDTDFTAGLRGRDLKMTAAAFLYNVTGNTDFEDVIQSECLVTGPTSDFIRMGEHNQLYALTAYLNTPQAINYPALQANMIEAAVYQAKLREANYSEIRPSRRSADGDYGWFHTEQQVQRTILAHSVATDPDDKAFLEDALTLEADWSLGRNSANVIQMTTATTALDTLRSIQQCYTTGFDDGSPGVHPGHSPYMNIYDWGTGMIMSRPTWLTDKGYPDIGEWPKSEAYFDVRYVYAHCEFTPAQTMRGKQSLYGYLSAIGEKATTEVPVTGIAFNEATVTVEGSEEYVLETTIEPGNATNTYLFWESDDEEILTVGYDGVVTGISVGTSNVTVTTYDRGYTDVCEVTVSNVEVTGIQINPSSLVLLEGDSEQLEPEVLPGNALNKKIVWESDDPLIAEVDEDGFVTAIVEGIAIITATTEDGGYEATCEIAVEPLPDQLVIYRDDFNRIDFNWVNNGILTELEKGGYEGMKHYYFDYELVDWWAGLGIGFDTPLDVSRFRDLIIGINGPVTTGHFIFMVLTDETGEATEQIILTRSDAYQTFKLSLDEMVSTSSIDLSRLTDIMFGIGGASSGEGEFYMDDIYFSASSSDIPVSGISVFPSELTLDAGLPEQLSALITPTTATDKSVAWSSMDADVATVSTSGKVEGVGNGSTFIVALTGDGGFADTVALTVQIPVVLVTDVSVAPLSDTITIDETLQLTATVLPENATDPSVSWSSDDISVATVNEQGQVTGVAAGETIIRVTTNDGGYTAGSEVTVIDPISARSSTVEGTLDIYPNPARNQVQLRHRSLLIESIDLLDITGKKIRELDSKTFPMTIDIADLDEGLFLIRVVTLDSTEIFRLVKK